MSKLLTSSSSKSKILCPLTKTEIRRSVTTPAGDESRFLTEFEQLNLIGSGGYGYVVSCINKLDQKKYAVKMIPLKESKMPFNRVLREVLALSSMHHPRIVRYFQAWLEPHVAGLISDDDETCLTSEELVEEPDGPCLYIQMELCASTLHEYLDQHRSPEDFNEEEAWEIFGQILNALVHIHERGYIHRDLSRDNIFLDENNNVKVGDFGLAKALNNGNDYDGRYGSKPVGNELYRAPEINVVGTKIDAKADVYSLGIILGEIMNPFKTDLERFEVLGKLMQEGEFPGCWKRNGQLIRRLISKQPLNRPLAAQIYECLPRSK